MLNIFKRLDRHPNGRVKFRSEITVIYIYVCVCMYERYNLDWKKYNKRFVFTDTYV